MVVGGGRKDLWPEWLRWMTWSFPHLGTAVGGMSWGEVESGVFHFKDSKFDTLVTFKRKDE